MTKEFGLLIEKQGCSKDWVGGGYSAISEDVLVRDGQWGDFIPVYEAQRNKYFDTMSCVTYSALNCLEMLHKNLYGEEINWSDRFIAKASDTTKSGNYLRKVAETIRLKGLILEKYWSFEDYKSWEEYMADIPEALFDYGEEFLQHYSVKWEWVYTREITELKNILRYAPLQVTVYAWEKPVNSIYERTDKKQNHAVALYGYKDGEYWLIYDHYSKTIKKLAWNFKFGHIIRYNLIREKPMKQKIDNNTLVQLVEGKGGFGLVLDGKIIVDDLASVQASFILRNNGDINGKTLALTQEQWDEFEKINLKKDVI